MVNPSAGMPRFFMTPSMSEMADASIS